MRRKFERKPSEVDKDVEIQKKIEERENLISALKKISAFYEAGDNQESERKKK
ncbi:hypothetical protein [Persicobacter diffluens]|uniref:Uncharacterized protein n=1 Tax=Persicobacter diffluens TaxID=981 RepID=A0AAN4W1Y0_9BACT|nr:hypothetical protein PEDI_35670 [Persicobacter diffluens]